MGFCTCCGPGASGRRCRKTCRRRARCTTISNFGTGTAPVEAFITRCTWRCVEQEGREASPTTAIINSQPKRYQKGGLGSILGLTRARRSKVASGIPGRHAGPPVERRVVHPADIQDRDGAFQLLRRATIYRSSSASFLLMADTRERRWHSSSGAPGHGGFQIVKRSDAAGFEVLPKRWIVERTFAWMRRNRRLARDFERYAITVAAFHSSRHDPHHARRLAANASS